MSATVTHSAGAKVAATNGVIGLIGSGGFLRLHPTGSTVGTPGTNIASLPFSATAFGTPNGTTGVSTANAITSDTNATGGTVAFASFQTSGGSAIVHCAVAASASDINMTGGLTVNAGDTVSCSSLTYAALSQ